MVLVARMVDAVFLGDVVRLPARTVRREMDLARMMLVHGLADRGTAFAKHGAVDGAIADLGRLFHDRAVADAVLDSRGFTLLREAAARGVGGGATVRAGMCQCGRE